jgi:1,4-alpha-glucan branching enzyme
MKKRASTEPKPTGRKHPHPPATHAGSHKRQEEGSGVMTMPPPALSVRPGVSTGELRRVRFGYFQPDAGEVFLVGSFNGWNPRATPLKRDALGDWSIELELPPGEYRYRLVVDGDWRDDPSAQQTAMNPFGGFDALVFV